ncbi:MAG: diaminopimelate epimerase [Brumimicrobium sp.]
MKIGFQKYQGTGNDFVMIDSLDNTNFSLSKSQIKTLCDRRFGIGADGVILIYQHSPSDFEMRYFNADGSRSFCGNGARCAVRFAHKLGLFEEKTRFLAIDGIHEAELINDKVALKMNDVDQWQTDKSAFILDTGSPHYIKFTEKLEGENIVEFGKSIRYSSTFEENGINVNLVEITEDRSLSMLTYERGVEDETYSCGTGATAVALAYMIKKELFGTQKIALKVKGGSLSVQATRDENKFTNIYLIGPASSVFYGEISI